MNVDSHSYATQGIFGMAVLRCKAWEAHPWHIILIQAEDFHVKGSVRQVGDVDDCCTLHCVIVPDQHTAVAIAGIKAAQDVQRSTGALRILQGTRDVSPVAC